MSAPVVDHVKRSMIQEIVSKSPFNMFNIVAIVAIVAIGYYLYRKFNKKFANGAIKLPTIVPAPARKSNKKESGTVIEVAATAEPEEESEDEVEDKKDNSKKN